MKKLMDHEGIAQKSKQPCVKHCDLVTKGTYTTIYEKNSHTQFFIKYLDPLVNEILSLETVEFIKGCSTKKLLAYNSKCRSLAAGELTSSVDSRPHMDRTKRHCGDKKAPSDRIVQQFRILVYLADSVIVPISHILHTESTLRIYWFSHHHTVLSRTVASQTNRFADYRPP